MRTRSLEILGLSKVYPDCPHVCTVCIMPSLHCTTVSSLLSPRQECRKHNTIVQYERIIIAHATSVHSICITTWYVIRRCHHISYPSTYTRTAWLTLSSCLGDGVRARIAGVTVTPRHGSYGRSYVRNMHSGAGQAGWEQIEMEDMMNKDLASGDES